MQRTLRGRQRGVTFIGWVFLLLPLIVIGYAAVRVGPVYLNYTKVSRALDSVKKEYGGSGDSRNLSRQVIRESLGKRFNIDMIYSPDLDEISIDREGDGWKLTADYEHQVPLFYNISLLLKFNKTVTLN